MGVINVTPDSFSGDGLGTDVDAVVRTAELFREWGADVLDVGGESTRPASIYAGAGPVGVDEELARVVPAIEAVAREVDIPVSVDTTKAAVAEEAIAAGAAMVNDQWALSADERMLEVVSRAAVPVVLMHNRPDTHYADLVPDVVEELRLALRRAVQGRRRRREDHPRPRHRLRQDGGAEPRSAQKVGRAWPAGVSHSRRHIQEVDHRARPRSPG